MWSSPFVVIPHKAAKAWQSPELRHDQASKLYCVLSIAFAELDWAQMQFEPMWVRNLQRVKMSSNSPLKPAGIKEEAPEDSEPSDEEL